MRGRRRGGRLPL